MPVLPGLPRTWFPANVPTVLSNQIQSLASEPPQRGSKLAPGLGIEPSSPDSESGRLTEMRTLE